MWNGKNVNSSQGKWCIYTKSIRPRPGDMRKLPYRFLKFSHFCDFPQKELGKPPKFQRKKALKKPDSQSILSCDMREASVSSASTVSEKFSSNPAVQEGGILCVFPLLDSEEWAEKTRSQPQSVELEFPQGDALVLSASAVSERFFVQSRNPKGRNTLCISPFGFRRMGGKDPLTAEDDEISASPKTKKKERHIFLWKTTKLFTT